MKRAIPLALGATLFFSLLGPLLADPGKETLRCTLTNTKLEKCCCQQREGKLYCPLAKKTIEKCCCEAIKAGG